MISEKCLHIEELIHLMIVTMIESWKRNIIEKRGIPSLFAEFIISLLCFLFSLLLFGINSNFIPKISLAYLANQIVEELKYISVHMELNGFKKFMA